MLLRLMFVLLIALNIAVAAWLLLGESGTHAVDPSDSGVPKLKLLAELPAPSGTAGTPAVAQSVATVPASASAPTAPVVSTAVPATTSAPAPVRSPASAPADSKLADSRPADGPALNATAATNAKRSYRCLAIGPFANQVDLRGTRTAIASRTVRSRQRQEQTSESHGWRVFLPSQPTRELALAQARRLEAKGVKDYFVVTASGELQNSVALGLFHDPANARKRRDDVIAAGFPARMSERTETTPVWWLDVVVPEDGNADIRKGIRSPGVSAKPTGCF